MKYIKVGTIVNTHALKGEVRIISNFEYKDRVFKINNTLYIGMSKSEEVIETYRVHKNFDMVKFKGIDNITDVLKYKGSAVYVNIDDLKLKDDEILIEELLGMSVIVNNKLLGSITDYIDNNGNKLIVVNNKYIPYNKDLIEKIDKINRKVYYKNIDYIVGD